LLQREGWKVNHKRIYRLYKEEGLQMRTKVPRRRVSVQVREGRPSESCPNECWSMDFVSDQLFDGRRIRILTIVDNFTRVSPFIGVDFRQGSGCCKVFGSGCSPVWNAQTDSIGNISPLEFLKQFDSMAQETDCRIMASPAP